MARNTDELQSLGEAIYRGRYADPIGTAAAAEALRARAEAAGDRRAVATALLSSGAARWMMLDVDGSEADLREAEAIFAALGDACGTAAAVSWLGSCALHRGEQRDAMAMLTHALHLAQASGSPGSESDVLLKLGFAHRSVQALDSALETFLVAKERALATEDRAQLCRALLNMCGVYADRDEYDAVAALCEEVLRDPADVHNRAAALSGLGRRALVRGELAEAEVMFTEWLEIALRGGSRRDQAFAYAQFALLYQERGEHARACESVGITVELGARHRERAIEATGLLVLGTVLQKESKVGDAVECYNRAQQIADDAGLLWITCETHSQLADLHEAAGDAVKALRHHRLFHESTVKVHALTDEIRAKYWENREEVERIRRAAELRDMKSELRVLTAQLQPHFVLNALNSIGGMLHIDSARAEQMVVRLGDLFRLALRRSSAEESSLREELEFVEKYLELERIRFAGSLRLILLVQPEVLDARIPHLMLQTLVENSLRHGILPSRPDGEITISARCTQGGMLTVGVADNGSGLQGEWSSHEGLGLRSTRERLHILYGSNHSLAVGKSARGGVAVEIQIPCDLCG